MPKKKSHELKEICANIGMRIRERRLKIQMTRKKFAELLDLSQVSVSNIEGGRQSVSAEKLYQISVVLGCSPHLLLPSLPQEFEKLVEDIKSDKEREWAEAFIKNMPQV